MILRGKLVVRSGMGSFHRFKAITSCVLLISSRVVFAAWYSPVMNIAEEYPDGGGYSRSGTGVPEEIRFNDKRILSASTTGTYCSGFTFAVVMRALARYGLLEGKTVDDVRAFQQAWYGATDASKEKTCVIA